MSVAEWVDTYGIHHWRILWSSYRKLAWVRFEPTTTEFRSDALTDWVIRPWVQLALRANFVQLLQFHGLFTVTFHFGCCHRQSPRLFYSNYIYVCFVASWPWLSTLRGWRSLTIALTGKFVYIYIHIYIHIDMYTYMYIYMYIYICI